MPDSWAKALAPTIALLGWTLIPLMVQTRREVRVIPFVLIALLYFKKSFRTLRAITTSSRLQLPARSPMPLMVHSTWRTPALMAARLLATASPRSLWQCTEKVTPDLNFRHEEGQHLPELLGDRIAHRI